MTVVEAAHRFRKGPRCAYCAAVATVVHFPFVDHRRRRPWPEAIWTCTEHDHIGTKQARDASHR